MGPAEPEIMSQDAEDVIGLQPGQSDREGAMAKADLYKIANYSHKLFKQIEDQDQMEAWVQAKITKAADYIASVYHYLEYEMKFSRYGQALEDSEVYSESQKQAIKNRLMEAKDKVKELKVKQAEKVKKKNENIATNPDGTPYVTDIDPDEHDAETTRLNRSGKPVKEASGVRATDKKKGKVSEGILSGGHKACTECGGSGMVYEEPKAIPDHVKSKVEKYNRQAKAFHAASKRLDRNKNGIPDDEEMEEGFEADAKIGSTKKTPTGELTKTDTGVKHKNTSYKDDGDELDSIAKSGKGKASHAKAQSAEEKAKRAPAQKQSPKSAKTWGMKDSEKFDNRDGAPAKPKKAKEEELDEGKKKGDGNLANNAKPYDKVTKGDVIAGRLGKDEKGGKAVKEAAKPSAGLSKEKKSAVVKDAKAGKDIGKPGKSFDKTAKAAGGGEKGEKIAAAAMWKNIKETQAYIAEKSAVQKKDKPTKGNDVADEGNEFSGELAKAKASGAKEFKVDGKTYPVNESADLARMKQFLTRLNG